MARKAAVVYPELNAVFEKLKGSFKFQREASEDRKNTFSTSLYVPIDGGEFDFNYRDFLYPFRKVDMHLTGTPINPRYFWGFREVDEFEYRGIKTAYEVLDDEVSRNHYSNDKIKEIAEAVNSTIKEVLDGAKGWDTFGGSAE